MQTQLYVDPGSAAERRPTCGQDLITRVDAEALYPKVSWWESVFRSYCEGDIPFVSIVGRRRREAMCCSTGGKAADDIIRMMACTAALTCSVRRVDRVTSGARSR